MNDFDVVVVGAGPAGTAAAYTIAKSGRSVALLERGPYPGSKNLMGGVLYTDELAKIIPDFEALGAPFERHVHRKKFSILSANGDATVSYGSESWDEGAKNHSRIVLRARFDRWLAAEVEKAGAELVCGVTVDSLVKDATGRVVGVRTRMPEGEDPAGGELSATLVILADGANSLLMEAEGMRPKPSPERMALGVKQVIGLTREKVEDRFSLEGDQGVAWEMIGAATSGVPGGGFVYTNGESVSIGLACFVSSLNGRKLNPAELLDSFKDHPAVRPLIKDGEVLEYGAHMIPETGYNHLPLLAKDGLLAVGDCAGLIGTGPSHEGTNFAMGSGRMAGLTALECLESGDVTLSGLAGYKKRLEDSFIMKKMEQYRDWPDFCRKNPHVFASWPAALSAMAEKALMVGDDDPRSTEEAILDLFNRKIGLFPALMTGVGLRNALRILGHGKTDKIMEYVARNW